MNAKQDRDPCHVSPKYQNGYTTCIMNKTDTFGVYLNQDGCLSHVQKLFPLQVTSEPALQEDDLMHDILVECVLQLLSLQLLEEHLKRENTPECTCTAGNRCKRRQEGRYKVH